ncbi:LysR family transcriptional regulator [Cupriavidus sp. USMAA2-4]|uniref:LysR family transcriptional regulator n=1 Tax=Cupriavidus malaysiensis TaxID=367825 RepID=A0ABN4TN51_9BURK|nr:MULTISPECIES: LysR family transcriptional regulator [Cupriavidus]AOY95530.1 LysR family transcriptional regulator [Cupriavidus sp. USMAA2-4]AOZ01585.1 LysR family transcriptional regulator [Cupriavidus sp. USMAHM13]AOZ08687.1 LysR family transcriptional regulator [Cupriavidus malaysiensis]
MDRLQSMRVFTKVVELGSFARAAQQLEMSNAVVTRYVADLESHLGTRLLNRTTRSLSLTDAGETYLQRCQQILEDLDEAEGLVTARSQSLSGTLRLVTPVMFGLHLLPALMARFQQRYPEVVFDVMLSDRNVDIVEEGRDVAVMLSDLGLGPHLVARPLVSAEIVMCASPGYLRAHPPLTHPRELSQHSCIAMRLTGLDTEWTLTGPEGELTVPVRASLLCSNAELAHQAALADLGVAMLGSYVVRPEIEAGRLVHVLPQYQLPRRDVSVVYPSRKFLPTKVRAFIDFLVDEARVGAKMGVRAAVPDVA